MCDVDRMPELAGSEGRSAASCITCGDVAVPMRVMRVDDDRRLALCENDCGERESVETALVEPVEPGDTLLVHAGTALTRMAP